MGEMNASTLIATQKSFRALFRESFDGAPVFWPQHAMEVQSANAAEIHQWLGRVAAMKEWIETGECELPKDARLREELTCLQYNFTDKGRIRMDRKQDIWDEYGFSPDRADALAMTFAYPVADFSEVSTELDPKCYAD